MVNKGTLLCFLILGNILFAQVDSTPSFVLVPDTFSYNTSGALVGGSSYNVLTNDSRRLCSGGNNVTIVPLTSNFSLTGSSSTPSYFTILPNGNITPNIGAGGGTTIPSGQYNLTYQICDTTNQSVCYLVPVTINVITSFRLAADVPKPIIKRMEKVTTQSINQIINFPDVNLKVKLLDPLSCFNTTNGDYQLADANGDGEIDTNEALQVGRINIANAGIIDLTGLEYFLNLKEIYAPLNNISSFNLSSLNMTKLDLWNNPLLSSLNVSSFPNLTRLFINNTLISSLNVSSNPNLSILGIVGTPISSIVLQNNTLLSLFYCSNNSNLASINIKNTSLLDYSSSFMQQDCWRNCPNLNYICADSNEIPVLQSFLGNCGVNTSGITIDSACALGVDDALLDAISIAPNPSTGIFEITFPNSLTVKTTATVYTMLGQKMMSINEVGNSTMQVNLSGYPNGTYLLELELDDKRVIKKLIKQ